jgi:hypothetical protein
VIGASSLDDLSRDGLARREGAEMRVTGRDLVLMLDEVSPRAVSGTWESFSLVFRGPADAPLAQGTYGLEDAELGALELFLVPIGRDARGFRYEAAFTREDRDREEVGA